MQSEGSHVSHGGQAGHVGHARHASGPVHDLVVNLFFAGRRRAAFARLVERAGVRPGDRVLDVGCGDGYLTRAVAAGVGARGSVLGVDPSTGSLARARRITRAPNCTFVEGRAQALDLPDSTYDVVVSSLMVHHLPEADRSQAMGEMLRVLRPGGRLLVAEFRPPSTSLGRTLIRLAPFISDAMEHNPVHLLEPMVRDAGFESVARGDLRPWLCYVTGTRPAPSRT